MLQISHNCQYMMGNNIVYDVKNNTSHNISELNNDFWFSFIKENIKYSFINQITDEETTKSYIREFSYGLTNTINENLSFKHKFNTEKLLTEQLTNENISDIVESIFYDIKKDIVLTESWFGDAAKWVGNKVSNAFNWVKEKGIEYFFEGLRKALYSWAGVAVQVFLSTAGAVVGGPLVVSLAWGSLLAYDVIKGFTSGEFDWVNILIDLLSLVTMGAAGKAVSMAIKSVAGKKVATQAATQSSKGLYTKLKPLIDKLRQTSIGQWFVNTMKKVLEGMSTYILTPLKKSGQWLEKTFNITIVNKTITKITEFFQGFKSFFNNSVSGEIRKNAAASAAAWGGGVAALDSLSGDNENSDGQYVDNESDGDSQIADMDKFNAALMSGIG